MTSVQYEELCRYFVAAQLKIPLKEVKSLWIPNPERDSQELYGKVAPFKHQIDLYWETGSPGMRYVNIANAKWRSRGQVHLADVLLLQQVKIKVGAHKAIMITNSDFTSQAREAAHDEGIGLLVVRPLFRTKALDASERSLILKRLQELEGAGSALYASEIVRKGVGPAQTAAEVLGVTPQPPTEAAPGLSYRRRCFGPPAAAPPTAPSVGGPAGSASANTSSGQGPYPTRQGPGPGFRMK
jgi:hypothetical protein